MTTTLSNDIFRLVLDYLDAQDILNTRLVCKEFYDLSKLRSVWESLLQRHVLDKDIPIPGLGGQLTDSLSSKELEESFHKACALRRNWLSDSPKIKRSIRVDAHPGARLVALHILPGQDSRWLVSLSMNYGQQRTFIVQCWDLSAETPVSIAKREFSRFGGMVVNKMASSFANIAVLTPNGIEILSVDPSTTDEELGFVNASTIQVGMSSIHYLHGSRLVARGSDGRMFLLDINNPEVKIEFQHTMQGQVTLIDFVLTETFFMALNSTTLELYGLPSFTSLGARHIVLFPLFVFQWPWRIDTAVMTVRHGPTSRVQNTNNPITIFIRFGSLYPWAINLLHRYEIRPNLYFSSSEPPNELNIPYEYPPVLCETIGSPIRLHAPSDLVIGPYGTAIWTDSHTEDYFNHADRGQRIAGAFARLTGVKHPSSIDNTDDDDEDVGLSDEVATSTASFVYAYHEEDSWVRLAIDETEGRIFAGRDDGVIEVFEYA